MAYLLTASFKWSVGKVKLNIQVSFFFFFSRPLKRSAVVTRPRQNVAFWMHKRPKNKRDAGRNASQFRPPFGHFLPHVAYTREAACPSQIPPVARIAWAGNGLRTHFLSVSDWDRRKNKKAGLRAIE